jgi:hypothetical protein
LIGTSLITFYYFYLYLTKTTLDIFNCSPTTPPEFDSEGKEIEYLEVTFAQCGLAGGTQQQLVGYAAFGFALYSIGFPAGVGGLLYRNRLLCQEDQLLRAKRTGFSRATNPNCWEFRKKFHKIYEMYKPQYYYWAAAIMGRKLLIACAGLMFRRSPVFLLAFSLLTLFVAYALQVRYQPFMHDAEYAQIVEEAERAAAKRARAFGNELDISSIDTTDSARKKRVGLGNESAKGARQDESASLAKSIYNYNTIESTLLFCAILVVLSGLMFQSDAIKPDSNWERGLLLWTFSIVMFSIVFFFAVVGTEIAVGLGIWDAASAKKKLGMKNDEEQDSSSSDDEEMHGGNPIYSHGRGAGVAQLGQQATQNPVAMSTLKEAQSAQQDLQRTIAQQKAEITHLRKAAKASQLNFAGRQVAHNHGHGQKHSHRPHSRGGSTDVQQSHHL